VANILVTVFQVDIGIISKLVAGVAVPIYRDPDSRLRPQP
jgi:hypothetical protein